MKQIIKDIHNYTSNDLIDKYLYYKEERNDSNLYYIIKINSIDFDQNSQDITYLVDKCYLLYVPKNDELKAFVYDNYTKVDISKDSDLYEMSFTEFVNTFRVFVNNNGKLVSELPSKLIQDQTY